MAFHEAKYGSLQSLTAYIFFVNAFFKKTGKGFRAAIDHRQG